MTTPETPPAKFTAHELSAIDRFIDMVERRAESNMLNTGKLEGMYYAALKSIRKGDFK